MKKLYSDIFHASKCYTKTIHNYLKSYSTKEKRWLLIGTVPPIIWMACAYILKDYNDKLVVTIGITITLAGYTVLALNAHKYIMIREKDIPLGVILFVSTSFIYILIYSFYYGIFTLASPSNNMSQRHLSMTDSIYFSMATFTTLGYGDFLPNSSLGKYVAITQTLLGTAHTVFFILIFMKNGLTSKQSN